MIFGPDDLAEKVTGVGVLQPGDRLIIVIDPLSTPEVAARIGEEARRLLASTQVVIVAAEAVVIDRSAPA